MGLCSIFQDPGEVVYRLSLSGVVEADDIVDRLVVRWDCDAVVYVVVPAVTQVTVAADPPVRDHGPLLARLPRPDHSLASAVHTSPVRALLIAVDHTALTQDDGVTLRARAPLPAGARLHLCPSDVRRLPA